MPKTEFDSTIGKEVNVKKANCLKLFFSFVPAKIFVIAKIARVRNISPVMENPILAVVRQNDLINKVSKSLAQPQSAGIVTRNGNFLNLFSPRKKEVPNTNNIIGVTNPNTQRIIIDICMNLIDSSVMRMCSAFSRSNTCII